MNISYINQVNQAINYIIDHLEEDLDVNEVAKHCHFSKYYFNRLFKAVVGESVYAFVKRLRIEKSAFLLKVEPDRSITEIGETYRYSSSNYSSVFKQHYKYSPLKFRKLINQNKVLNMCSFDYADLKNKNFQDYDDKIHYIELPDMMVLYERYKGNYLETSRNWGSFLDRTKHLRGEDTILLDISYDDPVITDENRCIYGICMTVEKSISGFNTMTLLGGRYVSYSFEGHASKIFEAYQGLLGIWLPNSDAILDDRRIISLYKSELQRNDSIKMDICIPIK